MSARDLLRILRKRPFKPFRMLVSDGTDHEIRHPELVMVVPLDAAATSGS
jgi:hypothetical protein